MGILYNNLERSDQRELLRQMVERVVVNRDGKIIRLELLPPIAYLREVSSRVQRSGEIVVRKKKTSETASAGLCSDYVQSDAPDRTRTCASASGGQRSIH